MGNILGYGIIIAFVFSFAAFIVGFEGQGQLFFGFAALFALILFVLLMQSKDILKPEESCAMRLKALNYS